MPCYLLQQRSIHTGLIWIHHATKRVLLFRVDFFAISGHGQSASATQPLFAEIGLHLAHQELLVLYGLLLARMLLSLAIAIVLLRLLHPHVHILLVGFRLALLFQLLFSHLLRQVVVKLLVPEPVPVFLINVLEVRPLILLDALLYVQFLLLSHPFLLVVADYVAHRVHHGLDALAPLRHLCLPGLLLLQSQPHVLRDLLLVFPLDLFQLDLALAFLVEVLLDDAHRGLAFFHFLARLRVPLFHDFGRQSVNSLLLLVSVPLGVVCLFLFGFCQHNVTHLFLLDDFELHLSFLLPFKLKLFLGLLQDLLVEVFSFFLGFFTELGPESNLLVEHISHLFLGFLMLSFLHFDLLLV